MRRVKIKDILNSNEKTINPFNYDFIHYLDTGNITRNLMQDIPKLDTKKNTIPSRAKRSVKKNTIVYSLVRPNLEHYGIIRTPLENMVVSTGFVTFDVQDCTIYDADYVYYNLTQRKYTNHLHTIARNNVSNYPAINPSDIEEMEIEVETDIEKQKKISKILRTIDQKIELNQKINSELEKIAKALYNYWFVQFDFPDEFGRPYKSSGGKMVYNEVLKREIPTNWEVLNLGERLNFEKGIEPGESNYIDNPPNLEKYIKFYRVGDMDDCGRTYLLESNFKDAPILNPHDVVVSFDGSVGRLSFGLTGMYSSGIRRITDKFGIIDNSMLYFIFQNSYIQAIIQKYASGSNILHAGMSIAYLTIPYNEKIFQQYQTLINSIYHQLVRNKLENNNLLAMRDFLLPMLMNEQVTVNS